MTTIGERLRLIADQIGVEELAGIMGMHRTGLYVYFRGRSKPGSDLLNRLVAAGYNATWVLSGIGPMLLDASTEETNVVYDDEQLVRKFQDLFESIDEPRFIEMSRWFNSKTVTERRRFILFIFFVVDTLLSCSKKQRSTLLRLLEVDEVARFENELTPEEQRAFLLMLVMDAIGYDPSGMKDSWLKSK